MKKRSTPFSSFIIVILSVVLLLPLLVTLLHSLFRDLSNLIPAGFTFESDSGIFVESGGRAGAVGMSLLIAIIQRSV